MSTTAQISPGATKIRRWATYLSWGLAALLLAVVAVTQTEFLGNAIETALAIFAFGVFASTKQSRTSFLVGFTAVTVGLLLGFTQIYVEDRPLWATALNALVTVATVSYATYGPGQRTHLNS